MRFLRSRILLKIYASCFVLSHFRGTMNKDGTLCNCHRRQKKKKETVIIYTTFAGISTISAVFFRKEKRKENEGKKVRFKYITASSGVKK